MMELYNANSLTHWRELLFFSVFLNVNLIEFVEMWFLMKLFLENNQSLSDVKHFRKKIHYGSLKWPGGLSIMAWEFSKPWRALCIAISWGIATFFQRMSRLLSRMHAFFYQQILKLLELLEQFVKYVQSAL